MKKCSKCGMVKPHRDIKVDKRAKDGLTNTCKDCWNAAHRQWRQDNRHLAKARHRRDVLGAYGLTPDSYALLVDAQHGACAICGGPQTVGVRLDVDHDHACCAGDRSCGECIRGLLCRKCNMILGLAKDSALLLRRAASYLEGKEGVML